MSKNCATPLPKMTPVRLELCGAFPSSTIRKFIIKDCRFAFLKEYFVVDSEIVKIMIHKETYGFNSLPAVCIGEIQEEMDKANWYWTLYNADWITHGRKAVALSQYSTWQNGPDFLKLLEDEWPVQQESLATEDPVQVKSVLASTKEDEDNLVLAMYNKSSKLSIKNVCKQLTAQDLEKASMFWVQEAQRSLQENFRNGKYKRLGVMLP